MPQVSRNKLSKKVEKELIESIMVVCAKISKTEDMMQVLTALLTDTEKLMLAKRLAMIVLLKEGFSDADIAKTLHITRISM